MALKIRFRRQGRRNRPFYRLVVTDSRTPRDGKYIEMVGWYNPIETEKERVAQVKPDRIDHWIGLGAQMTEKAQALVKSYAPEVIKKMRDREEEKRKKQKAKAKAKAK